MMVMVITMVSRRRRREMGVSVIDVDDTYVIDGEGQPAILALEAQVSKLPHVKHRTSSKTSVDFTTHT